MDITKIIGIGIIGTLLSVTLKQWREELAVCTALCTGAALLAFILPEIEAVLVGIYDLCENTGLDVSYFKLMIKITGVAYITQFAAETARDSGFGAIGKKLEFAGKIVVLTMVMPTVTSLIEIIVKTLSDF